MRVRPAIAELRADDSPLRRAQASLARQLGCWREAAGMAEIERQLAEYDRGAALVALPALAGLFGQRGRRFADSLCAALITALTAEPLAQPPLRHYAGEAVATLLLARAGAATLSLQAIDGTALVQQPAPDSVVFSPGETVELVLAGLGAGRLLRRDECCGALTAQPIDFAPDLRIEREGRSAALLLDRVDGILVTLRLQRRCGTDRPALELALDTGEELHRTAAHPRDSRIELAAALLGRMGRRDAAPLLCAIVEERGSAALRWQVLRECLALDSGTGFTALSRLAGDPRDPLATPARALRAQLLEAHPQLRELAPCPA